MTDSRSDLWLKRVWLVNGVVLLVGLVAGLGAAVVAFVSDWHGNKAVAVAAPSIEQAGNAESRVRAVRFDIPDTIRGTSTRIVLVHNGAGYLPSGSGVSEPKKYGLYESDGPIVNVAFLPGNGAPGHLLFDRPAFVKEVSYPGGSYGHGDSLQTWIAYEVVLTDSNGDGSLDENDDRELLVSDLDGNNVRHVLPRGLRLDKYSVRDTKTMVVTALDLSKQTSADGDAVRRAPELAFLYDVATGRLQPFAALDSLVARAGRAIAAPAPASR
jgi:hypothetical protein